MPIFNSSDRIILGKPMGPVTPKRPQQDANFVRGETSPGTAFCLEWWGSGGIGYHVFRSKTVSQIRENYIGDLWSGKYRDSVQHFVVGARASKIIDDYRLHGSTYMFYWVLTQEMDGTLSVLDKLTVRGAAPKDRRGAFVIEDKPAAVETVAAPVAAPPKEDDATPLRQVDFIPYEAPMMFQIVPVGAEVDHFNVYIGPKLPDPAHCDPLWDERLLGETGLTGYALPGAIDTFEDKASAPGANVFVTVFAALTDGKVVQCQLGIPDGHPPQVVQLT